VNVVCFVNLGYGEVVGGVEVGLPTKARIFSFAKDQIGSTANTSSIHRVRDAFSSELMRPSRGGAQLLPSSRDDRK
jgi:hypothetical protein